MIILRNDVIFYAEIYFKTVEFIVHSIAKINKFVMLSIGVYSVHSHRMLQIITIFIAFHSRSQLIFGGRQEVKKS